MNQLTRVLDFVEALIDENERLPWYNRLGLESDQSQLLRSGVDLYQVVALSDAHC